MGWFNFQSQNNSRPRRVLAASSGGGHWVQLLRLRPAFSGCDVTYLTVDSCYRDDIGSADFHVVPDASRWSKIGLLRQALRTAWLVLRVQPDVVISTGASIGYFAVFFGKLFGARTVWLDSIANVEHVSLSGEKAGKSADLWLTQWPQLQTANGPQFRGAVL